MFAFVTAKTHLAPDMMNNYTLLADAWLHGHSWVAVPGPWIDAMPWGAHAYVVEAPFPAVLMLPLVALLGHDASQTILTAVLAPVAAVAAYRFARGAGDALPDALLVTAFFIFGTDVCYGALSASVWLVAHLCAVTFTMLALAELQGRRRLWLVILFGLCAALSRYPLALALPVYAWLLRDRICRPRELLRAALVTALFLVPWMGYNVDRWRTLGDPGFSLWYRVMDPRSHTNPAMLALAYLPQQIRLFFFEPPHVLDAAPWIVPVKFGNALTFLSPGLLTVLDAPLRARLVVPLALLAVVTAIPALLYYDTGGFQFGARHTLDFIPFLVALMAVSFAHPRPWKRLLVVASTAFNVYLLFVWYVFPDSVG